MGDECKFNRLCVHEKVFHRTFYTSYTTGSTSGAVSVILFEHRRFSTNNWHSYWYHLYSPSRWRFPLFVGGILHTGASQENEKILARSFNFTFRYIDDVLSMKNLP